MPPQQAYDKIGQWSIAFELRSPCSKTLAFFDKVALEFYQVKQKVISELNACLTSFDGYSTHN
jgi:hypothetical protein